MQRKILWNDLNLIPKTNTSRNLDIHIGLQLTPTPPKKTVLANLN